MGGVVHPKLPVSIHLAHARKIIVRCYLSVTRRPHYFQIRNYREHWRTKTHAAHALVLKSAQSCDGIWVERVVCSIHSSNPISVPFPLCVSRRGRLGVYRWKKNEYMSLLYRSSFLPIVYACDNIILNWIIMTSPFSSNFILLNPLRAHRGKFGGGHRRLMN